MRYVKESWRMLSPFVKQKRDWTRLVEVSLILLVSLKSVSGESGLGGWQ